MNEFWRFGSMFKTLTLRKHAHSNILRILPPKDENFQIRNSDSFHISAQNIDCEYPQSMF